jgi:Fic family protein
LSLFKVTKIDPVFSFGYTINMKLKPYNPSYTITSNILNLTNEITETITKIELEKNYFITPKLRRENQVKTLVSTLAMEGNSLDEERVTAMIDGNRVLGSMLEIAEIEGAINSYEKLSTYRYDELDDLLEAHSILMRGIIPTAGNFRSVIVSVGDHVCAAPDLVEYKMQQLFEWLKESDEHPLIKSSIFHYEFEFIHPFVDGNGRLGRLWQSVILYHWKEVFSIIPTESIIKEYQSSYYKAIKESIEMEESTPFIEFMLEVILQCIVNVPEIVIKNVPEKRKKIIVEKMKEQNEITIRELALLLRVNEKTVKRDIERLKELGKISREGSARRGFWKVRE